MGKRLCFLLLAGARVNPFGWGLFTLKEEKRVDIKKKTKRSRWTGC
jgi:hypothetical protein